MGRCEFIEISISAKQINKGQKVRGHGHIQTVLKYQAYISLGNRNL